MNQTDPDPYMPIRALQYDAAAYRSQIPESGQKSIHPVTTIVLYCGYERRWNGPGTLRSLLAQGIPPQMDSFINDYRINLVELAWMSPAEIDRRFHGDFRIFANHLAQRHQRQDYVPNRQAIRHIREVAQLLSVTERDHRFEDAYDRLAAENTSGEEGTWTMCDLLDRIENSGIEKGRVAGREEGARIEREQNARGMQDIGMTLDQIAAVLRTDVQTVSRMLQ